MKHPFDRSPTLKWAVKILTFPIWGSIWAYDSLRKKGKDESHKKQNNRSDP